MRYMLFFILSIFAISLAPSTINGAHIAMPKWCEQTSIVVTCTAADESTLKQLSDVLLMEVLVDFVLIDTSHTTCTCAMVHFVKALKDTDTVVLTNSTCSLEDYKSCGEDVPEKAKVSVAGLIVSPADSRMRWAIKHHVIDLWNKAKAVKKSWQRTIIFKAILKDVSLSVIKLGNQAVEEGSTHLIFGDLPPEGPREPAKPEVHHVDSNLKEQLWDMHAQKQEKASAAFSDNLKDSMSMLNQFDAALGGKSIKGSAAESARQTPDEKVRQVNEAVMEANLDNQLAQIKEDLKSKGRRKRHGYSIPQPRSARSVIPEIQILRQGTPQRLWALARRHKRAGTTVKANVLPYKIFVGGDYTSLFDAVSIDLAASMEANLPKHKLMIVQEAKAIMAATPPPKPKGQAGAGAPIMAPARQGSGSFAADPVHLALLAEGGVSDDIDDVTGEDVIDELNGLDDDHSVLEEEERMLSQMSGSVADKGVQDVDKMALPPAAAAVAAAAAESGEEEAEGKKAPVNLVNLEEERRRTREQDHIFKNFIVFIVAIIGIIVIFAVLIIMSMKRRPSNEDLIFFQRARERQIWEHEHLTAGTMNIRHNYDGVTPPSSPFAAFNQPTNYGDFTFGNREQRRSNQAPEVIPSKWEPPLNMEPLLLGGRHVVTEFEDQPQPTTFVSQRSRSPTWPYFMQQRNAPRGTSPPPRAGTPYIDYFGADRNNSNNSNSVDRVVVVTVWSSMTSVWELCPDTAYLNHSAVQTSLSVDGRRKQSGRSVSAELARPIGCSKRSHNRCHNQLQDRQGLNRGSAHGCSSSSKRYRRVDKNTRLPSDMYGSAKESRYVSNSQNNRNIDNITVQEDIGVKAVGKEKKSGFDKNRSMYYGKRQKEDSNKTIANTEFRKSHRRHHQRDHYNKYRQNHSIRDHKNNNECHLQIKLPDKDNAQEESASQVDCNSLNSQIRRRRSHRVSQQSVMIQSQADPETSQDTSLNKRDPDITDASNNWFFGWFKKEDPRDTEERFYGGKGSSRRARLDEAERARRSLENRFRTAVSPHSAFPQPRPSLTDKVTSTEPIQADKETTADIDILGVSTNDAVTGRRLLAHRPLPYGSFKTVSLLLESPKDREAKDLSVYVTAHDMPPFPTRLQPFAPYDTEESPLKAAPDLDNQEERGKGEEVEPAVRLPPVQFRSHVDTVKGPLERPFHHPGIAWPLAFASQPPYVCPGHEVCGVKQPVGVLQTRSVPSRPLKARAWELDTDIPAWISPLYKTYGIGGPYGRNGPFAEPSLLEGDLGWDAVLRQAEGLGALDIPGVITDNGRLDLTGLCGTYVQLKKEEEARLARQRGWKCKPCTIIQNWIRKVKTKLGIKTKAPADDKKDKGKEGEQTEGEGGEDKEKGEGKKGDKAEVEIAGEET